MSTTLTDQLLSMVRKYQYGGILNIDDIKQTPVAKPDAIPIKKYPAFAPQPAQMTQFGAVLPKQDDTLTPTPDKSIREHAMNGLDYLDRNGQNAVVGIGTQPLKSALRLMRPDKYFSNVHSDDDIKNGAIGLGMDAAMVAPIVGEAGDAIKPFMTTERLANLPYTGLGDPLGEAKQWMKDWVSDPEIQARMYKNNRQLLAYNKKLPGYFYGEPVPEDLYKQPVKASNITGAQYPNNTVGNYLNNKYGYNLMGDNPSTYGVYIRKTGEPLEGNAFVAPNSPKQLSTGIHEMTHQLTDAERGISEQTYNLLRAPFGGWTGIQESLAKNAGAKTMTDNINYLTTPTEIHARVNELRNFFDLKPGDVVDGPKSLEMYKAVNAGKTPVVPMFGKLVKDPKAWRDMFNKMFTPTAAAAGTYIYNQNKQ